MDNENYESIKKLRDKRDSLSKQRLHYVNKIFYCWRKSLQKSVTEIEAKIINLELEIKSLRGKSKYDNHNI